MTKHLFIAVTLISGIVAKAQSVRLIGYVDSVIINGSYEKEDTVALSYSFGRGLLDANSAPKRNTWAEDTWHMVRYNINTQQYVNDKLDVHEYDNHNRITGHYIIQWQNNAWDTLLYKKHHYTNGKLDTTWAYDVSGGLIPLSKNVYEYGTYGEIFKLEQTWNPIDNVYKDHFRTTTTYINGKPQEILTELSVGTNAWQGSKRRTMQYVGNNISLVTEQLVINSSWVNSYKTEYTFDANNDLFEEKRFVSVAQVWEEDELITRTYDNNHNVLSETVQEWAGVQFHNTKRKLNVYNSNNLIDTVTNQSWDNSTNQFMPKYNDFKTFYLYAPYDPASISIMQKQSTLRIYPNPASNLVNITVQSAQSNPFSLTIYDATGKAVQHWNEPPTSLYQKQVDVSGLPSGNYFLRIDNQPQEMVKFTILK